MPFCPGCGKEFRDGKFCRYCGAPRPDDVSVPYAVSNDQPRPAVESGGRSHIPYRALLWCSLGGAVAMALAAAGSFLPWLERSGLTISGTDRDGWLTFVFALAGVTAFAGSLLLKSRWLYPPALVFSIIVTAVAVFDAYDILRTPGLSASSIGIGLWLVGAAGLLAVVASSAGSSLQPVSGMD